MKKLNWAVIGPGSIAHQFGDAMNALDRKIYAVGARNLAKAQAFAEAYQIEHVYDDFEALLSDENIDAVYVSTPHASHYQFMMQALKHNKHILAEKAITINAKELEEINQLAMSKGLIVAEAMTIFHMPLFRKLTDIAESGKLGALKMIQVSFGSFKESDPTNRFFNMDLAGGALLDIGTYALSFARLFLTEKPTEILTTMKKYQTGVDEQSAVILKNKLDEMAIISLTFRAKMPKRGIVAYENGFITVDDFPRADKALITYTDGKTEQITAGKTEQALQYEIIDVENSIATGKNDCHQLTIDVVDLMTDIRKDWGMRYPFE